MEPLDAELLIPGAVSMDSHQVTYDVHIPALKTGPQNHVKKKKKKPQYNLIKEKRQFDCSIFSSGFISRALRERTNESQCDGGKALRVSYGNAMPHCHFILH